MSAEESDVKSENDIENGGAEGQPGHAEDFDQVLEQAIEQAREQEAAKPEATVDERVHAAEQEVLRTKAEMENFRKRMQRDSEQQLKYANMGIIRDLLEVVDNLERATVAAEGDGAPNESLLQGVKMVSQQFVAALEKYGCKRIEALGVEFDPNVHEAISQMPSAEYESGVVMQEVAIGYKLHDRVVRPSNVIVSTGAPE